MKFHEVKGISMLCFFKPGKATRKMAAFHVSKVLLLFSIYNKIRFKFKGITKEATERDLNVNYLSTC